MNVVITMSDSSYFEYGELFIKTRNRVNAKFILYGPDLIIDQQKIVNENDIEYRKIEQHIFDTKMQFLKFQMLVDNMIDGVDGLSFVDFDTFFMKDWKHIFKQQFDLGVTVRNDYVREKLLRGYANGGVIFAKNSLSSKRICEYALDVMTHGGDCDLPEYDQIFKTLEENRPAHKTHTRDTLRWWVDQVFLSSLVLKHGHKTINDSVHYSFNDMNIGLFSCDKYNYLGNQIHPNLNAYIVHLKNKGREAMSEYRKII
jgi:hypothetical protein